MQEYEYFDETAKDDSLPDKRRRVRCVVCDVTMLRNSDTLKAHIRSGGHLRSVQKHQQAHCMKASGTKCILAFCLQQSFATCMYIIVFSRRCDLLIGMCVLGAVSGFFLLIITPSHLIIRCCLKRALLAGLEPTVLQQALRRASSEGDLQKALCLTAVNFLLFRGRPMADYPALGGLLEFSSHPHFAPKHWTNWSGWLMAEANDCVLVRHMRAEFTAAPFFSMSCDETTDISKVSRLSIHAYVVNSDWKRRSHLIRLCRTNVPATVETLASCTLSSMRSQSLKSASWHAILLALAQMVLQYWCCKAATRICRPGSKRS
jgi:hypothetical protein